MLVSIKELIAYKEINSIYSVANISLTRPTYVCIYIYG